MIIGATAFPVHGYSRATFDLDIFIEAERGNAEKCLAALKKFGYDVSDISVEDLLKNKVLIRQCMVETDIHPFVRSASFERIWKNRLRRKFGKIFVNFASLDDLIKMKKAAGRGEDLNFLRAIRREKGE